MVPFDVSFFIKIASQFINLVLYQVKINTDKKIHIPKLLNYNMIGDELILQIIKFSLPIFFFTLT